MVLRNNIVLGLFGRIPADEFQQGTHLLCYVVQTLYYAVFKKMLVSIWRHKRYIDYIDVGTSCTDSFFLVTPNFLGNPSRQLANKAKLSLVTKLEKLR